VLLRDFLRNPVYEDVSNTPFFSMVVECKTKVLYSKSKSSQSQHSLFSLGMFTYTYERQDIIQIALKRLPRKGWGERRKKKGKLY
jgi:hypothetical protein